MKKYIHISNDIKNKIIQEIYQSNEKLPSEKELGASYEASKMTVKQALDILVAEGLIIKRRGAGTFIKDLSSEELKRVAVTNQFRGKTSEHPQEQVTSKVFTFAVITPDQVVQNKLNITADEFVYHIYRSRKIAEKPLVIEETYMPISLITGLKQSNVEHSIYDHIENTLGLVIQSVHRTITVRPATDFETVELSLEAGQPVGVVEQVGYLSTGAAFEYSVSVHRYDQFRAEVILNRGN